MYLVGGMSCQWLHCLSRIAVINFAHTPGRSLGGGGLSVWQRHPAQSESTGGCADNRKSPVRSPKGRR